MLFRSYSRRFVRIVLDKKLLTWCHIQESGNLVVELPVHLSAKAGVGMGLSFCVKVLTTMHVLS